MPKLELLGQDPPYVRSPTGAFAVTIAALGLLLPTHEGTGNGITAPGSLPAPPGSTPVPGVRLTRAACARVRAKRHKGTSRKRRPARANCLRTTTGIKVKHARKHRHHSPRHKSKTNRA